ncbi:hypothetical protein K435DRAFT_806422 [Dendrothele bispora CBS 962.96]|uniref:Uncharacterized protein n=1 Tax=Dendrothele bispora (strain CBS 962.96) TaxID=1314807 RepID=A0A4S8L8D9_DENBC|nr:hypothetical protein K435DRAFT_806422 [Dendrothele bispora CBS 962.96]
MAPTCSGEDPSKEVYHFTLLTLPLRLGSGDVAPATHPLGSYKHLPRHSRLENESRSPGINGTVFATARLRTFYRQYETYRVTQTDLSVWKQENPEWTLEWQTLYLVLKYNPDCRYDFCLSTGVPTNGEDCIPARPDIYLNVSSSLPIQSPIPTKPFTVKQPFAFLDCRVSGEYDFIPRPESRKPIPAFYRPSSLDALRPCFGQFPSQLSNTGEGCSDLKPIRNGTRQHSIVATDRVQSTPELSVSSSDNGSETSSCTSFAAHYGANSFANQWPATTYQTYATYPA